VQEALNGSGSTLVTVRDRQGYRLLEDVGVSREIHLTADPAFLLDRQEFSEQALQSPGEDMLLSGQTRLMGLQDMSDMDRLRDLFEAFSRKREILGLLERCTRAQGVRVFIGEESGLAPLDACTVITAPSARGGQVLGVLGVIGPTRMSYERVIPIVQATADLLGQALNPDAATP
jgi:heat-inducible transcriptional repressor